jgi:hypothetical protein
MTPRGFPIHLWALAALYCLASLVHFTHNAEYIAFYPNMPGWLTRETVYLAWLVVFAIGVAGAGLALVVYGALGLFGLGHYSLALCAQHTLAMNATIWFEVATGVGLAAAAGWFALSARRS